MEAGFEGRIPLVIEIRGAGVGADGRLSMLEIFELAAVDAGLVELWNDAGVGVWAAGAAAGDLPAEFARVESCLFVSDGQLRLDATTVLAAPALALLPAGTMTRLDTPGGSFRAYLWTLDVSTAEARVTQRRVVLGPAELMTPRTITASTSILHWLPARQVAERRTLAGNPSLALNLGTTAIPMVAGPELVPLAGRHGAIASDVVTLRVVPGSGPVVALERIVPT